MNTLQELIQNIEIRLALSRIQEEYLCECCNCLFFGRDLKMLSDLKEEIEEAGFDPEFEYFPEEWQNKTLCYGCLSIYLCGST